MSAYAQVVVNVPSVAGVFDYGVPVYLVGLLGAGHLVIVPFNKQTVQGVVLRLMDQPSVKEVKEIAELVDPWPVLTQPQIALAESMAKSTLAPLAAIIEMFLPSGLSQQADTLYEIRETGAEDQGAKEDSKSISPKTQKLKVEDRILDLLLKRGSLRGRQIDRHFSHIEWRRSAQYLVKKGILSARSVLPPASVRPKFIRMVELAVAPGVAEAAMPTLGMKTTLERRQKALRFLMREKEPVNVSWVYAESGCNLADLQELAERELVLLRESEIWRDPLAKAESRRVQKKAEEKELELTPEQENAWKQIAGSFQASSRKPFLLHGVTGSGKTELYIRAAQESIRRGKQVLILVPEISLTPQIVQRFLERFPGQVGLVHSKLSDGERYDTWRRARAGLLKIVIGARSALFAPLPNLGLIVLDECHDGSYYQAEPPFYHAVTTAQTYAKLSGAVCLLGSATPSIVQRYQSESGESIRLELSSRIPKENLAESNFGLPPVSIIDMRKELKAGSRGIFSRALLERLESTLKKKEQAILFLNRRGTATYVFCRDCGYAVKCPRCDTPMTLHTSMGEKLLCHHCGYDRLMPQKCPECNGANIRAYGLGSEKVESEVQALFPKVRTLRWDWETTRQKDSHEIILGHFAAGRADVLIGTQMLAKGLDLPKVTLVGIVFADVGLNLPDPFAAERVFQVLTQVAGRAGRSSRGGEVILQTFVPEHYAIQAAAKHDVNGFYGYELEQRKRLGYPPFARLVKLEYRHYDATKAAREARAMAGKLTATLSTGKHQQTNLIGPVPCYFSKLNNQYRWQIVLRGPDPVSLLGAKTPDGWRVEVEPVSLL